MSNAGAILDYASPRKRSVLRLPAKSLLDVQQTDGRIVVQESLAGQTEAVVALAFGTLVLLAVLYRTIDGVYDLSRHRFRPDFYQAYISGVLWLAEAATMVGVLQQTWRRTLLAVEYNDLRLAFLSPLRRRYYRWTGDDIADVFIKQTATTEHGQPLGELVMTCAVGGEIRLFTDHVAERLGQLAVAIHGLLREGRTCATVPRPLFPQDPQRVEPTLPNIGPGPELASGRLLDAHRAIRRRHNGAANDR